MRSEGSSVARATSTVRNRSQHVRSEVAKPHHWAALTKCDPDDVLEVNFLANSMLLLRFVTCVEVAFAFCVAGAILFGSVSMRRCVFLVAGAAFCDVRAVSKVVAGAAFCELIEKWWKLGKTIVFIFFELCKSSFIRKARRKSLIFSFKVSKWRKSPTKCSFWKLLT